MKHSVHSIHQTQQIFTALVLTSIVSVGAGMTLVDAASAKSLEPALGNASTKQLGDSNLPVGVVNAVSREISRSYRIPPGQLRVVSFSQQDWSDSCLGLGQANESCSRVLSKNGWRVVMSDTQQSWTYRTDNTGRFVRLESLNNSSSNNLPDSVANIVLRTASQRTGLRISDLRIVKSKQITVDGCLGLPRPGEYCTKIAQQAWEVTVEGGKQSLVYRISQNGSQIRLNEKASNATDANLPQSISTAVLRFAARDLGISTSQLQITKAEQQTWDNRCLGLPRPTERCMGTPTPGWRVTVQGRRRVQVYRTDSTGFQIRAEETSGGGVSQGTIKPIPIPTSEISPLGEDVIFRAISSGGFAGIYSETFLMNDGRVMRQMRQFSSARITTPTQIYQLSRQEVRQFQQLLEQQQFSGFNRLSYPAPNGAADFITVTLTSQAGTTRYADMIQNQLPESLQSVIQSWNQIAARR